MTSKLKNRDCAHRMKYGSPKLQDVLREKCRHRMREKRDQLFNKNRFGLEAVPESVQGTLMDILREEFKSLAKLHDSEHLKFEEIDEPLSLEAALELENQIVREQEQWILHEYEKISRDEVEHLSTYAESSNRDVFCPLCQQSLLVEDDEDVCCKVCKMRLNNCKLERVGYLINESVRVHAFNCAASPVFMMIPDDTNANLYLVCNDCYTLALIC